MDEVRGNLLIVGDGDFSFTVAFAEKLKNETRLTITTSTLLNQEELYDLHRHAQDNVVLLESLGVRVWYEIDATRLSESIPPGAKFDTLIFNFPHTGGKSNIKKNRQLLRDFFDSAAQLLGCDGQVLVTLARGQGGTPVDQPIRQWHDSWQVIGQAAFSGWIVHRIDPFSIESYPQYGSTGFRSLDRQFYTKDSMTYFFKNAPAYYVQDYGYEEVDCKTYLKQLHRKYCQRSQLMVKQHPVSLVTAQLLHLLEQQMSAIKAEVDITVENGSPGPIETNIIQQKIPESTEIVQSDSDRKIESCDGAKCDVIDCETTGKSEIEFDIKTQNVDFRYWIASKSASGGCCKSGIRSTMFEGNDTVRALNNMTSGEDTNHVYITHGDVYRRTFVDTEIKSHVLTNEMFVMYPVSSILTCKERTAFQDCILSCIQQLLPDDVSVQMASTSIENIPLYYRPYVRDANRFQVNFSSKNAFSTAACNQVSATGKPDPNQAESLKKKEVTRVVGYCGTVNSDWMKGCLKCGSCEKLNILYAVLDLDSLAVCRYDIPDFRLLWSQNSDFLDQFKHHRPNDTTVFKPLSFHPPLWRHDLSFWEKKRESVNESQLIDIISGIADGAVTKVLLMNVWTDPDTGLISKCYRIVYQSLDRPLSHSDAHELQNAIRLTVAKQLGVTLR